MTTDININIETYGGRGDGGTDNTGAFAAALDALGETGGGTLRVGPGVWRTGPVELRSGITLHLEEGARVLFDTGPERCPPVFTRWEGVECFAMRPLLFARNCHDVAVEGRGTLDGGGEAWWLAYREKRRRGQAGPESPFELELARLNAGYREQPGGGGGRGIQFLRPPLAQFYRCSHVRVEGVTFINSPFWTLHPVFCEEVLIRGIAIANPPDAPNSDGIDIDSCERVVVEGCRVSVGDDGIALKSGAGEDGRRVGRPTRDVTVRDCLVEAAHGGIVIGSETAGGIDGVLAEGCRFTGTDRGIRVKTRRGRGGRIENLRFRGIVMENNLCPLAINMYYRCGADGEAGKPGGPFSLEALPVTDTTPSISNVTVEGCRAGGCRASAGFIAGLPEAPVENLTLRDCEFSTDEASGVSPAESDMFLGPSPVTEKSLRILNVKDFTCERVVITGPAEPFLYK